MAVSRVEQLEILAVALMAGYLDGMKDVSKVACLAAYWVALRDIERVVWMVA